VSVALFIQHAKRVQLIIVSSVARPAVPYFSTYLKRARFSSKIYWSYSMCFDFLNIFVWNSTRYL